MSLTKKEVEHLAKLARIELTEKEVKKFQNQLSSILDYVAKLKKVDTTKVDATFQSARVENITRKDQVKTTLARKKLLEAAPARQDNFYKVKAALK